MNDRTISRRNALSLMAVSVTTIPTLGCKRGQESTTQLGEYLSDDSKTQNKADTIHGEAMRIHYLEIVTTDVEAICALYAQMHGVTFADSDQNLGGARTARLESGGMLGVRAPMHDGEKAVTRPYILVADIEGAVAEAAKSGAEIAVPPMEIAGHGTCAIFLLGGIEAGLWQL